MTSDAEARARLRAGFDALAPRYDALRFVRRAAERAVELAAPGPGERVLDVATGTGRAAIAAAAAVGPAGAVVGVDLSPGMLAEAARAAAGAGVPVRWGVADAERLPHGDGVFDVALCASSLFFVPDMLAAARELRRVLAPGGRAVVTSFGASFLQPGRELWASCLRRHGLEAGFPPVARLGDRARCAALLRDAGFAAVEAREEQLGYRLAPEERWEEIAVGAEGAPLHAVPAAERERIRAEHLAELTAAASDGTVWVDVPVLLATGWASLTP